MIGNTLKKILFLGIVINAYHTNHAIESSSEKTPSILGKRTHSNIDKECLNNEPILAVQNSDQSMSDDSGQSKSISSNQSINSEEMGEDEEVGEVGEDDREGSYNPEGSHNPDIERMVAFIRDGNHFLDALTKSKAMDFKETMIEREMKKSDSNSLDFFISPHLLGFGSHYINKEISSQDVVCFIQKKSNTSINPQVIHIFRNLAFLSVLLDEKKCGYRDDVKEFEYTEHVKAIFEQLSLLEDAQFQPLAKGDRDLLKMALRMTLESVIIHKEVNEIMVPLLSQNYGPISKKLWKKILNDFISENEGHVNWRMPALVILECVKFAFLPESEIDFDSSILFILNQMIYNHANIFLKQLDLKELPCTIRNNLWIGLTLNNLWIGLTLNKNRKDLENNPIAQENAQKASKLSNQMLQNFLDDKTEAPSKKLLQIMFLQKEENTNILSLDGEKMNFVIKNQNSANGSKFFQLPQETLVNIDKYLRPLVRVYDASNPDLMDKVREKVFPRNSPALPNKLPRDPFEERKE